MYPIDSTRAPSQPILYCVAPSGPKLRSVHQQWPTKRKLCEPFGGPSKSPPVGADDMDDERDQEPYIHMIAHSYFFVSTSGMSVWSKFTNRDGDDRPIQLGSDEEDARLRKCEQQILLTLAPLQTFHVHTMNLLSKLSYHLPGATLW